MPDVFYDLRVGRYRFDVQETNWGDDTHVFNVVAKKRKGACVTVLLDSSDDEGVAVIESIAYADDCGKNEDGVFPRKYGTRTMLLGFLHALVSIARRRTLDLRRIQLADESSYACPPFAVGYERGIKTYVTDLLLGDATYYERHLGMRLLTDKATKKKHAFLARMKGPIDVSFPEFWGQLLSNVADDGSRQQPPNGRVPHSVEEGRWLVDRHREISRAYESSKTWRSFFEKMKDKYDCVFFSCCWRSLVKFFGVSALQGAAYEVAVEDLPPMREKITLTEVDAPLRGGKRTFDRALDLGTFLTRHRLWRRF